MADAPHVPQLIAAEHRRIAQDNEVWRLYVTRGMTTRAIAAQLGIAASTVSASLNRAEKRALASLNATIVAHKLKAMERLEQIYLAAMAAFADGQTEKTSRKSKRRTGIGENGAPSYDETAIESEPILSRDLMKCLEMARSAVADMRRLLGLDAPLRVQPVAPDRPYQGLTDDQVRAELAAAMRLAGVDPASLAVEAEGIH